MQDNKVNNTILIVVSGDGVILLLVHFGLAGLESTKKLIYSNLLTTLTVNTTERS